MHNQNKVFNLVSDTNTPERMFTDDSTVDKSRLDILVKVMYSQSTPVEDKENHIANLFNDIIVD